MGAAIILSEDFGNSGWAMGPVQDMADFVAGASRAFIVDAAMPSGLFSDLAGTNPVTAFGQQVRRINDRSGQGRHAYLRAGGTSVPTWQQDESGNPYIRIPPQCAGFEIENQLTLESWSCVGAVSIEAVTGITANNWPIVSQYGTGFNSYIALQIMRTLVAGTNRIGSNLSSAGGLELVCPEPFSLGAPLYFQADKDVTATRARLSVNGSAFEINNGPFTSPGANDKTHLFAAPDTGAQTSGRLYFVAFVNEVRDTSKIAAIARTRLGL